MKVLLTGANGYIGRRLKQTLLGEDISLRLLVRNPKSLEPELGMEVVKGNTFDSASLETAKEPNLSSFNILNNNIFFPKTYKIHSLKNIKKIKSKISNISHYFSFYIIYIPIF